MVENDPNRGVQIWDALERIEKICNECGLEFVYDERDGNVNIFANDCESLEDVMANVFVSFEGGL